MPLSPASLAARASRLARGLRRDERGVTTVEFAVVGFPFFALICAVLEVGLSVFTQQNLDNAVDRAARTVFTGSFQEGANETAPKDRFKAVVCANAVSFDCNKLLVEVTVGPTFRAQNPTEPYDAASKAVRQGFGSKFQCPSGNDIVTVRAALPAGRYFGFIDPSGSRLAAGGQLLVSTSVFRAEPYAAGKC